MISRLPGSRLAERQSYRDREELTGGVVLYGRRAIGTPRRDLHSFHYYSSRATSLLDSQEHRLGRDGGANQAHGQGATLY